MSLQSEGSVTERSAGAPETRQSASDNGSAGGSESFLTGLQDAGARSWVEKKGYKTVDDLAKAAHSLEGRLGSSLTVPAPDADDKEWEKFYSKAGRPEKPDAYELKRPDGLPEDLPYDEALAGGFKAWAHKAGLNGRQAQTLHDQFAAHNAKQFAEYKAKEAEREKAKQVELNKAVEKQASIIEGKYGPQNSETFKAALEKANRAFKKLPWANSLKKAGLVNPDDGAILDAELFDSLVLVGDRVFAEDKIDGDGSQGGTNPFKEPKNITAISRLAKNDPDQARRLAREAGVDPEKWLGGRRK